MEDVPNTTSGLKERFDEFTSRYKGNIRLHIAAENMLDTLFEERLKDNDLLTIGNSGQHLLVETSYVSPPYAMDEMIDATMKRDILLYSHIRNDTDTWMRRITVNGKNADFCSRSTTCRWPEDMARLPAKGRMASETGEWWT